MASRPQCYTSTVNNVETVNVTYLRWAGGIKLHTMLSFLNIFLILDLFTIWNIFWKGCVMIT